MNEKIQQKQIRESGNRLGKGEVVVLSGHRRAGKSMILENLAETLKEKGHVSFLDMENPDNVGVVSYVELNDWIKSHFEDGAHNYILIDEVQEIAEFERTLRYWIKQESVDVIVTGSNAYLLSSEISTIFAGRSSMVHIYSLSYDEFLQFYGLLDSDDALAHYLRWGGLPFLHRIPMEDTRGRSDYLESIYNTVFVKDIVTKKRIRNTILLDNLARYLADNCGKPFSANSIAKYMKNSDNSSSSNTIAEYVELLCDAYIIDKVHRYDIKGKRIFEQQEKYYFQDIGIRNYLCADKRSLDIEKVMENVVYLKLCQLGYDVFVGVLNGKEIDFVAKMGDDIRYVQVSLTILSDETYQREYGNLKLIKDNYPKYVVTMDTMTSLVADEGVITLSLRSFLLNGLENMSISASR